MKTDLLTHQQQEENLSRAYVRAVAAMAGYVISVPENDSFGIDLTIRGPSNNDPVTSHTLEVQLKATINLKSTGNEWSYPLKKTNYDHLREESVTPRILIVLRLPEDPSAWLEISHQQLQLQHCAYWISLKDFKETENKETITIKIRKDNIFNVDNLQNLMNQVDTGSMS